jgi:peptide/nickel transport system permease protein/glutathione transport system permease protein
MLRTATLRLAALPLSLLLVTAITFAALRLTGDPVTIYLDVSASADQVALLRAQLHLDDPLPVQFAYFLGDLAQGSFGRSLQFGGPAMPVVLQRLGKTAQLLGSALGLAVVLGVVAGVVAALRKDRWIDVAICAVASFGQSMPSFWLGILLVQLFALQLGWLPTSGTGTLLHLILPSVTLATFLLPGFLLITRTAMIEALRQLHVTAAHARGLSAIRVVLRHALRCAVNPILSFFGLQLGRLVGGSILTETIFAWPGVGRLMIGGILQRDLPVVVAGVFVVAIATALANLLVDLLQVAADPRLRTR